MGRVSALRSGRMRRCSPPPCHWLPAACRVAAAAAAPLQAAGPPAAVGQARVLVTLPSLLDWQPACPPLPSSVPDQKQRQRTPQRHPGSRSLSVAQQARQFTAAAARCGLLSDRSAHISPAIEAQLERILQRRGELEKLLLDVNRRARVLLQG